ncbi:YciI family protein [uncultured Roseibium sp.]|uniref:YciI family protein n=1 Tax=uncultured Roseibium sp. TaxID=1936171 RepID=UPI0032170291
MPFHIHCHDDPEKPGLRTRLRAIHLEYMIAHKHLILFGGPLKDVEGKSIGSTFALSCDTQDEVDAFLAREPYSVNGLFSSVEVNPMAVMIPEARDGFLEDELQRERKTAS